jgi:cyclic pyranopterin phosphate synthase
VIKDSYGRPLRSIRISITPRCNFNCVYCHHEGIVPENSVEMTPGEIKQTTELCAGFGIKKVKITGGEPLMRKDVVDVVEGISAVERIEDVSMTTNGYYLDDFAEELKGAGLDRVNVSLDTLNPEAFSWITRGGRLEKVLSGISSAVDVGLTPVKLNMVAMKGVNDSEIWDMIQEFSRDGVVIQLIELMVADREFFDKYYYELDGLEGEIEKRAVESRSRRHMQGRRQYRLNGASVEIVKPMHNTTFCAHCTRMRITADGKFKPCLMRSDNLVDFLTPMREGASERDLQHLFREAVKKREPYFKT